MKNIAILGASGAIGSAMTQLLARKFPETHISAFSRTDLSSQNSHNVTYHPLHDYCSEVALENAASIAYGYGDIDLIFVALGLLHDDTLQPEKSLRDLSQDNFESVFKINTIAPALIAKHFLPKISAVKKIYLYSPFSPSRQYIR